MIVPDFQGIAMLLHTTQPKSVRDVSEQVSGMCPVCTLLRATCRRTMVVQVARTSRAMTCLENSALSRAYPDAYAVKLGHDEMHLMRENFRPLILLEHV
jgi:hypothetical protein